MQIKFKQLIIPIILTIALTGGLFYYQRQNQKTKIPTNNSPATEKNSGIVLGNNDSTNNNSIEFGNSTDNSTITSGEIYATRINQIRNDIIKDINELNSRMKYKTVFDDNAIISYSNEVLQKNQSGIDKIKALNIDPKFSVANKKNIESLEKISESLTALKKSYTLENKTEAQKQRELYAYNLEQSDSVYKGIQIPK